MGGGGGVLLNYPGFIENIDALTFPRYDFDNIYLMDDTDTKIRCFTLNDYKRYSRHNGDGYTLITTRSCPHRCSYCINSYLNNLYGKKKTFRRRSVKNTINEIKYALKTIPTVKFINFMDDHFLVNESWLSEFYEVYPNEIRLPFIIRSTPEALTEEHIKNLKNCGLQVVQMGIQSASERTHREIFHRAFSREKILSAAELLYRYSIKGMYDFIIGNEFETDEEKEKTIHLMMELPKPYEASIFHIIPFLKTDIIEYYQKNNIIPRLDPYRTNYFDFTADDFFANLAKLVPYTDNERIRYYLDNKMKQDIRNEVFKLSGDN
jgi:radical SAM superfamily enzyme YgiQ (UPF0313 family)